jgi:hypothetical protein
MIGIIILFEGPLFMLATYPIFIIDIFFLKYFKTLLQKIIFHMWLLLSYIIFCYFSILYYSLDYGYNKYILLLIYGVADKGPRVDYWSSRIHTWFFSIALALPVILLVHAVLKKNPNKRRL